MIEGAFYRNRPHFQIPPSDTIPNAAGKVPMGVNSFPVRQEERCNAHEPHALD